MGITSCRIPTQKKLLLFTASMYGFGFRLKVCQPEPDPNESKVKQLKQQIQELNSRIPDLHGLSKVD